jgi:beta-glucosidase/6-phospho-beta-glucosidase/beta-galactosidase
MSAIALMAGFECSTHRRSDGVRVDILADTHHTELATQDYLLLRGQGMTTVREGLRWHVIEPVRGRRDWSSFQALADAAKSTSTEIIWDLLHFGFPDWVNPFHPDFPSLFADFAADFARRNNPGGIYVPVNEISFLAWAAGDVEYMYPYSRHRGSDIKTALCAASIAAIKAIRSIDPSAVFMAVDPMIAVNPSARWEDDEEARRLHEAQFEALDILLGRRSAELGGSEDTIDLIGLNHYPQSQWVIGQGAVDWKGASWVRPSLLLERIWKRYRKPIMIAETGCEGADRASWFQHIANETVIAHRRGVPVMGLCLYPILSHNAWTGERFCPNGLFDGTRSDRQVFAPLLEAVLDFQREGEFGSNPTPNRFYT